MVDKMMRNAGRGYDGTAKAIVTDDYGNQVVKGTGEYFYKVHDLDFQGKEQGDRLPIYAYRGSFTKISSGGRLRNPSPHDDGWEELTNSRYRNISSDTPYAFSMTAINNNEYGSILLSLNMVELLKIKGAIPEHWGIEDVRDYVIDFDVVVRTRGESGSNVGSDVYIWSSGQEGYSNNFSNSYEGLDDLEDTIIKSTYINPNRAGATINNDGYLNVLVTSSQSKSSVSDSVVYLYDFKISNLVIRVDYHLTDTMRAWNEEEKSLNVTQTNVEFPFYDEENDWVNVNEKNSTTSQYDLSVDNIDYSGKRKGDTIPLYAYRGNFTNLFDDDGRLLKPNPFEGEWDELNNSRYELITPEISGGHSMSSSEINKKPYLLFSLDLLNYLKYKGYIPKYWSASDLRSNVDDFEIAVRTRGVTGSTHGSSVYVWSSGQERYSRANTNDYSTLNGTRETTIKGTDINPNNAGLTINDDGHLRVLATTSVPNDVGNAIVYVYYIEVRNFTLITDYLVTDNIRSFNQEKNATNVNQVDMPSFDVINDTLKVNVVDSTTRKVIENIIRFDRKGNQIETLYDRTVNAGGTSSGVNLDMHSLYKGEYETMILVNTDSDNWSLRVSSGLHSDELGFNTFPRLESVTQSYSESEPIYVLPIYGGAVEVDEATTREDVLPFKQLNDFKVEFKNNSSTSANVKIKILRIFKG